MLGLSDQIYAKYKMPFQLLDEAPKFRQYYLNRGSDKEWFCFIPSSIYNSPKFTNKVLPKKGNLHIYEIPSNTIQPNPKITRTLLEDITDCARTEIKGMKIKDPCFQGISLGNAPAFVLANETRSKGKFISVAAGARLPECIRDGIATREIMDLALQHGYSFDQYKQVLDVFSPVNNLNQIAAQPRFYLGARDVIIPYKSGEELIHQVKKVGMGAEVNIYRFLDHTSLLFLFSHPSGN